VRAAGGWVAGAAGVVEMAAACTGGAVAAGMGGVIAAGTGGAIAAGTGGAVPEAAAVGTLLLAEAGIVVGGGAPC